VQSSQVDVPGTEIQRWLHNLDCQLRSGAGEPAEMLYDLEAGMPYLFVDQLVIQGPQESTVARNDRMRILLAVSGQWKGTK